MADDIWAAYKTLIDGLVSDVETRSTLEEWAARAASAKEDEEQAQVAAHARALSDQLTEDQRARVAELLSWTLETGAARVLDALDRQMEAGHLRLVHRGLVLPAVQENEGLASSWAKRRAGEPWPETCPEHDQELQGEEVPVRYGRWAGVPSLVRRAFPFANAIVDGGCIRTTDTVFTVYCDECRRGLLKWSHQTGNLSALPMDIAAFERRYE